MISSETDFLDQCVLLLFGASSFSQYADFARRLSRVSPIARALETGAMTPEDAVVRADRLWRLLVSAKERGLDEVELALLLSLVARFDTPESQDVLRTIGLLDERAVVWVSALARKLLQEGASNTVATQQVSSRVPVYGLGGLLSGSAVSSVGPTKHGIEMVSAESSED